MDEANATTLVQFSIKSYRNCSDRANRIQWTTMIQWWLDLALARYYLFLLFEHPGPACCPLLSVSSITPSTVNILIMVEMKWRDTARSSNSLRPAGLLQDPVQPQGKPENSLWQGILCRPHSHSADPQPSEQEQPAVCLLVRLAWVPVILINT